MFLIRNQVQSFGALGFLVLMFLSSAQAQTAAAPQPTMMESLLPFVVLMVIMYFLLLRPQVKKAKDHQKFVTELKRGDEVVTTSGILGKIDGMSDAVVTLDVGDGMRIKFLRAQIAGSSKTALEQKTQENKK